MDLFGKLIIQGLSLPTIIFSKNTKNLISMNNHSWLQHISWTHNSHINGLVHERHNSIANTLELRLFCTNPLISDKIKKEMSEALVTTNYFAAGWSERLRIPWVTRALSQNKDSLTSIRTPIVKIWWSYLYNGDIYTGKMASLYWDSPRAHFQSITEEGLSHGE